MKVIIAGSRSVTSPDLIEQPSCLRLRVYVLRTEGEAEL